MKQLSFFRSATTLVLVCSLCGCETAQEYSLTHKLWDKGMDPSSRPALEPKLELFSSQSDLLVTYDAFDERADRTLRRAYFAGPNESRIIKRQKPFFVDVTLATNMTAVPIISGTAAVTNAGLLARSPVNTDYGPGFELYRDGRSEGVHPLPAYNDRMGTASRIVLTPFAVAGDTVMVGLVVGAVAAIGWVASGCPPFTNQ